MSDAPDRVAPDYPLARLTTVRTGGAADWFARPRSEHELLELLAWAGEEGLALGVIGSGSNLLVADDGFRGLALKLDGDLTTIELDGERVVCGGGARLPSASAKAAGWGLAGIEFGVNIPGTAGGAVKMNANAYGGQLGEVLEWVEVCSEAGRVRRRPEQLGFAYRSSNLSPGEVVSRAAFLLHKDDSAAIKARMGEMRGKRREAQPSGVKTFGSTFKNPDDAAAGGRSAGQLLEAAGHGAEESTEPADRECAAQHRADARECAVEHVARTAQPIEPALHAAEHRGGAVGRTERELDVFVSRHRRAAFAWSRSAGANRALGRRPHTRASARGTSRRRTASSAWPAWPAG